MRNYKSYFYLIAVSVSMLVGCQGNKLLPETNGANSVQIPPDTKISMSLKNTLSQWFTLEISADGETIYTPTQYNGYGDRSNLPPQGVPIKSRISREQLEEIIREFEKQNFFSLNDSYSPGRDGCERAGLDAGLMTIFIRIGGREKTVIWDSCRKEKKDFPSEFFAVFNKIEELRWRKA
jgi:hypothetical protein